MNKAQKCAWFNLIMAAIFLVAIGLRCVHVATTWDMPFIRHLVGDAAGYFSWAQQIRGQGKLLIWHRVLF